MNMEGLEMALIDYLRNRFKENQEGWFVKNPWTENPTYYVGQSTDGSYYCKIRKAGLGKQPITAYFAGYSFDKLVNWIVTNFPKQKTQVLVSDPELITYEIINSLNDRFYKGCWDIVKVPDSLEEMDMLAKDVSWYNSVCFIDCHPYIISKLSMKAKREYQEYDGSVLRHHTQFGLFTLFNDQVIEIVFQPERGDYEELSGEIVDGNK